MRILVVEDEARIRAFLARAFEAEGFNVDIAPDGQEALYRAEVNQYDLIILDVMLPLKDGYAVCRELRRAGLRTPILMLTARDAVEDRVAGLDCGADDYLTKPFDFKELLARLRALARRSTDIRPELIRVADLALDTASHAVTRAGKPVTLTAKEYALLEFLMRNQNCVVNREQIAQHVWDENFDPFSNIIDVYIRRLRTKIDAGFAPALIYTRRGAGYILTAEPVTADD